jgi:hypothetical protein
VTGPAYGAGALDRRLVLEAPAETDDGAGGVSRSYTTVATVWALVTPLQARSDVAADSAQGGNALSNGARNQMSLPVTTPVPSPISNSNLLFVREQLYGGASDLTIVLARVLGVYG